MNEEKEGINFENNKEVDFNFNKQESPYKVDLNRKIKIEFTLQYVLDILHQNKIIVLKDDLKNIADMYGINLTDKNTDFYYVDSLPEGKTYFNLEGKESVLEIFKRIIVQKI